MEGLKIYKKGTSIEKVDMNASSISLLLQGGGIEVMTETIFKDRLFYLYPSDNKDVLEFIYILSGEISVEEGIEKQTLYAEDYFSAKALKEPVLFKALTDVTYLWVITEPVFHQVSQETNSLRDIIKQVEKKDRYTSLHSERVTLFSIRVGRKLNLSKDDLYHLHLAAELHDIGKINIPEEILNKPGKLTNEEFDIIKKHPGDGAEMVEKTQYQHLSPIIEQHHERLNGSGYPHGLKGDEILLAARIIAVCDTFDAMTEDRAYRKAFSAEFSIDEIRKMTPDYYDPDVVAAFEEILKEEGRI
ncbi:HD-GYP domain-containing protein [Jeotgalibacillus campisalis]|uniref:Phosphohydrolase n=1 Tax=Jeotgalibacillus campisalis TaxID=220754 RepID=A0A0C2VW25_9BACL|nr:HD domain-containing phosphohydrolase [Jeotgalibacillus campisalis]KIL53077.1 phosphohydrolase [Jeotgalibacillus campisalis]